MFAGNPEQEPQEPAENPGLSFCLLNLRYLNWVGVNWVVPKTYICQFFGFSGVPRCARGASVLFEQLMRFPRSRERFGIATLLCNAMCHASAGLRTRVQMYRACSHSETRFGGSGSPAVL